MKISPCVVESWYNFRRVYFPAVDVWWGGMEKPYIWRCETGTRDEKEAEAMARAFAERIRG